MPILLPKKVIKKAEPTKSLVQKLLKFCEAYSGTAYYPYQRQFAARIVESLLENDGEELTSLWSRQSGKTETVATVCGGLAVILPLLARLPIYKNDPRINRFKGGVWIGIFAPILDQAQTTFSRMGGRMSSDSARELLSDPSIQVSFNSFNGNTIKLSNGSVILCMSASVNSHIESKTFHMVITEETQEMSNTKLLKSIRPMMASCVCEGSLVFNQYGERIPIEEFRDSKILGARLDLKTQISKDSRSPISRNRVHVDEVVWKGRTGIKECVQVTTNSGRVIRGSKDHPMLKRYRKTRRLGWETLGNVSIGDNLAVMDSFPLFGKRRMFDPRLIGMLIGDGSYRQDGMVRYCSCDKELLEYVNKYEFKAYHSHTTKDGRTFKDGTIKGLCGELRALGIYGQTGKHKTLPARIDTYCLSDIKELLGGLYDTDGCVVLLDGRAVSLYLDSVSKDLLYGVMLTLDKMGIHGQIYTAVGKSGFSRKPTKVYRLVVSNKESVERFHQQIRFRVAYKQEKLETGIRLLKTHRCKKQHSIEGLHFERVVSIKNLGPKTVYNLTARDQHTYLVDGLVTHNTNGTLCMVGTPAPCKGAFYEAIQRNKKLYSETGVKNHFEYDYLVAQKYNPLYCKFVQKEMNKIGYDSDEFKMSYRLLWILERGMAVTQEQMVKMGLDFSGKPYNVIESLRGPLLAVGIDCGKTVDSTVVTVMQVDYENPIVFTNPANPEESVVHYNKRIINWLEIFGDDYDSQFYQIKDFLSQYSIGRIAVDATGPGDPMFDRISNAFRYATVIPYSFNQSSKNDLYRYFLDDLGASSPRIRFPDAPESRLLRRQTKFVQQMLDWEKSYNGQYLNCDHPSDKGSHDDYCVSAALANWACRVTEEVSTVEVSEGLFGGRR